MALWVHVLHEFASVGYTPHSTASSAARVDIASSDDRSCGAVPVAHQLVAEEVRAKR